MSASIRGAVLLLALPAMAQTPAPPAATPAEPTPPPASTPAPEVVEFAFHPTLGAHTETLHETRLVQLGEASPSRLTTDVRYKVRVERTSDGYRFHRDVASLRSTDGESSFEGLPTNRVRFAPLTLRVDFQGQIEGMDGLEEAMEDAVLSVPEERRETMARALADLEVESDEEKTWNSRIVDFAGNRFQVGELLVARESMKLPGGDYVDYRMLVRVSGIEDCGRSRCARVEFAFGTEIEPLAAFAGAPIEEMAQVLGKMENRGNSKITGDGMRLLEPGTMRVHREEIQRTILRPVQVPGQGTVVTRTEDRTERTWEYPASGDAE